jgi:putative DNA primase/helicase
MSETVHKIVSALGGKTSGGNSACCFCPAHANSKTPALSVSVRDGRLLVNCKSGCSQESVVAALKSRGLWPEKTQQRRKTTKPGTQRSSAGQEEQHDELERWSRARDVVHAALTETYKKPKRASELLGRYLGNRGLNTIPANALMMSRTESSKLCHKMFPAMVFPVIRDEKLVGSHVTFLSQDGYDKLATDSPRKIYGPVAGGYVQLARIDPDQPLIIGEGIETTLSAMQITGLPGIAALSTSGMKAINVPRCSEVIIAADQDENHAGKRAAQDLARRLVQAGRTVRIALPKYAGEDWNDVLVNDGRDPKTLRRLKRKILEADIVNASALPDSDDALTMEDFVALDLPPLSYLIDPILIMSGMTMLTAQPGGGKTRLCLSLAYSVAEGKSLLNWHVPKPCRVLYIDGELIAQTMRSWLQRLGPSSTNLRILSDNLNFRNGRPSVTLATEEGREYLSREIRKFDPQLIVLDSLMTLDPPTISQGQAREDNWAGIVSWIKEQRNQNRHVLILHHDNKSGSQYGSMVKEVNIDNMMQLKSKREMNRGGRWFFELSFKKPRHQSVDQAAPLRISANDTGPIEWRLEGATSFADNEKTELFEAEVFKMLDEGIKQKVIADRYKVSPSWISQIIKKRRDNARAEKLSEVETPGSDS